MNEGAAEQEIIDEPEAVKSTERAAGAPEGAAQSATTAEVAQLYKDLGIKAPAPTGKPKGRPKAADVRAKSAAEDGAGNTAAGDEEDTDDKNQSKNAPATNKNGGAGDTTDTSSAKNSKDAGKVQDESEESSDSVRDAKSSGKEASERGSEEDADDGTDGAGQAADESDDTQEEGKRPGKSNPAVEARIQKLANEKRAAEERATELERKLNEREQAVEREKIAQTDPEYSIDDFRKVRDENGNVFDLDQDQAELAYRRWKDGYDGRAEQRNAEQNRQAALTQAQQQYSEQVMRQSVEAYDTLTGLMDEYPELVSTSGQYDRGFAARAMPIIQDAVIYQEGTEPGNAEGKTPVIAGLRINPRTILEALKGVQAEKRSLPLNGVNDNVESRSNVSVPHSRSSDPTVKAANELYKHLGINKRV